MEPDSYPLRATDLFFWNAWDVLVACRGDKNRIMCPDVLTAAFVSVKPVYCCGKGMKWSFYYCIVGK